MILCCIGCGPFRQNDPRPEHVIHDAAGRSWRFELHHICGPIVLRQDGSPSERQPGSRSQFWRAFDAWKAKGGADAHHT